MNRPLKFKVWDKSLLKFVQFYPFMLDGDELYEICQFTGLKDKNGVEIYEGDIIKGYANFTQSDNGDRDGFESEYEFVDQIRWEICGFFCDNADLPLDMYQEFEILGNIFENPELLKP